MMGRWLLILFFCHFFMSSSYSQVTFTGVITDELGNPLPLSSVIVNELNTDIIIAYAIADENGKYKLSLKKLEQDYSIIFSSLGFKAFQQVISEIDAESPTLNVSLSINNQILEEVIVHAERPIKVRKDTIIFNASSFTNGTETVAEDLLRKIPGINISDDGTIKIGNQEVEKVMIENDDFFEKGYKTLTKNMPASPIEKVEILKRYSNNKLLKGIEESDKIAINLTLNEDAKRQWFGNIDLGYGLASQDRYDARANLLNFGKKNKYYFFTNLNNVGYDATGDINHLIRSSSYGEPGSIGDSEQSNKLIHLSNRVPYFKESRFKFNNAELISLNAIFNPSEHLKIKTIGFANWDELAYFRNSTDTFVANGTNFTNTEEYSLKSDFVTLFGKLDINYDLSKTASIEVVSKYSNAAADKKSDLLFNNTPTLQLLDETNSRLDQKIAYSKKFKNNKALLITGRYIKEETPQGFTVNQNNFFTLFEETESQDNISQKSSLNYEYFGTEAHWLDRRESGHLFEIKVGNTLRVESLQSDFTIVTNDGIITPVDFQNKLNYTVNDTYLSAKYFCKFSNKWSITGTIENHLITNSLDNKILENKSNAETIFFINPSLATSLKINEKNKITLSSALSRRNNGITEVYNDYALTGFRSFSRGTGAFNQLDASNLSLSYELGNWSDRFFATAFVTYAKSFDFLSTNRTITQDFTLSEKILLKDQELLSANLSLDNYLKIIKSNLKAKISYSSTNFQNVVNDSPTREVTSDNYSYGLELRSGFSGIFNYHIGTTWRTNSIRSAGFKNDFTNNESFLDLSFILNEKFNVQVQTERYFFGNLSSDNIYYFADLTSTYDIKKNKVSLSLSAKNLFNTKIFREFSISDIGSSTTEYRLLPRYALLKLSYRF
ncbi:hypothetical protein DCS32_04990 [Dokdonia sp. Dokd-P16]|nr:hypothetical protein DCS32_04990 [Dokdonia sp. Dokd-P16]